MKVISIENNTKVKQVYSYQKTKPIKCAFAQENQ